MEWFLIPWMRAVDFTGRSRRKEYWYFQLFNGLVIILLLVFGILYANTGGSVQAIVIPCSAYSLISFLPSLSCTVRRLHDTGRSGWWYWISIIPLIGAIVLLVFLVADSDQGWNEYGHDPKSPDHTEVVI